MLVREGQIILDSPKSLQESCQAYIGSRRSSYEFRCIRYEGVLDQLRILGLSDLDTITDVGAGDGEFGKYLRECGWSGVYRPVDGLIDGTDLNLWTPQTRSDFMVSIEVVEHLKEPMRLLKTLDLFTDKGVVVTTPNPAVVNVYAMDQTHINAVSAEDFYRAGYKVHPQIFFVEREDSLLAWKQNERYF